MAFYLWFKRENEALRVGHLRGQQEQLSSLRKELDKYRVRCERLEREKDEAGGVKKVRTGAASSAAGAEIGRLQQRVRELETNNEDLADDKRSAELRVQELERELEQRPSSTHTHKVSPSFLLIPLS